MPPTREKADTPIPAAINVMEVLRGVWRRKVLIGLLGFSSLAAGIGLVNVLSPVYSTEAQILIQSLETPYDRVQPQDNQRSDVPVDDRVITSQMAVVQSADLGRRVVAALGLEQKPEFNSLIKGVGTLSRIKLTLGFGEDPRLKTPEQRALGTYLDKLSVYQPTNSNIIAIKYSSSNPKIAAEVANTLAETYVLWTRESQARPTERAREWLAGQIAELRQKLAKSEEAVEKFRAEAGLLQGASTTLGTQEISELNSQITVAKTASSEAKAKADAIRELLQTRGSVENSSDVLASAAVQRLKEQRATAAQRVAELSATYLGNHPRMIAAQSEVAALDRQIRAEALKVVASLEEQARVAASRETSLRASLESLKSQESTANLDDVKLKALERDVAADRALLETLLSRYAEASTRQDESTQPGLARIIQTASVPSAPSFPKPGPLVVLITIAGFAFAAGLSFLMELMAAAARLTERMNEAAVRELAEPQLVAAPPVQYVPPVQPVAAPAPMLAPVAPPPAAAPVAATVVPAAEAAVPAWQPPPVPQVPQPITVMPPTLSMADAVISVSGSEVMAAAGRIEDWLQTVPVSTGGKRVGITSLGGSGGDTSVAALALARKLASGGKRVALADLSRSGSWLESLCCISKGPGLSELVSGAADFTKVIGRDARSPVHLLRYGGDRSSHATTLILERSESVLQALAQSYEVVVVNLGEAQPETPVLLHKCNGALIMAPVQRLGDVTNAVTALLSTGMRAVGHVLIGPAADASASPDFSLKSA